MKIGVVGLGKLGLPLAVLLSKYFEVYGVDTNKQRIKQITNRKPFFEPHVNEYLEKYGHKLIVSTDYRILKTCNAVFIVAQTPSLPTGRFDLSYVESALNEVHEVNPECMAIVLSTVNIGDMNKLRKIHKKMCYNPCMIKQGTVLEDFRHPQYLMIGAYNDDDVEIVAKIWKEIHNAPIYKFRPIELETLKLCLNVSLSLQVTFSNIIGELCEKYNIRSRKLLEVIWKDIRGYKAGLGFMGPCFPRDVDCFKATCQENAIESGYKFTILLNNLNDYIVERYIRKIKSFNPKKKIGILGVAYKPNVPYVCHSQPIKIIQELQKDGYEIYVYDPLAEENAKKILTDEIHFVQTIDECIEKSDLIFVGTPNYLNVKTEKIIVNPWK